MQRQQTEHTQLNTHTHTHTHNNNNDIDYANNCKIEMESNCEANTLKWPRKLNYSIS